MDPSRRAFLSFKSLIASLAQVNTTSPRQVGGEIHHLLNRISYGPRPGDVARVAEVGIEATIEQQLNPETIDDSLIAERLKMLPILSMNRRALYSSEGLEYRAILSLQQGMIERAVHSERQLFERMAEFWSDHFNVPAAEDLGLEVVSYQRDVIRRHALGSFRDLVLATAKHPAMLIYLDNYLNVAEHPNENYARELMELHTLGVDGGYTEEDVVEVARAFTGWTIDERTEDGFVFNPEVHDSDTKTILGHQMPAGRGIEDGLHVISMLVTHPATARTISFKLCRRFVSDSPPASLVESTTEVFRATSGNIKAVMRHILNSDEFWTSPGQKFRRPLDFLIAALRATGTNVRERWAYQMLFDAIGQSPFGWLPPDGAPDTADRWLTTNGLLNRWNVANTLTHGALSEMESPFRADLFAQIGQPATVGDLVDTIATQVYAASLPETERNALVAFVSDQAGPDLPVTRHLLARKLGSLYALMLASPLFQWR
ncbi:MAG: DUF1800 domain-containing protein [Chloroflexi bacterium]|nr:DUF1800 domain-containing protein [Chloroflexota bacterium]